MPLVLPGEVL